MPKPAFPTVLAVFLSLAANLFAATPPATADAALELQFGRTVRPFLDAYCINCHGKEKTEAELDLSPFMTTASVVNGFGYWELVLERLEAAEMPPSKAKKHPTDAQRHEIVAWIQALRKNEAEKNAG